MARPLLLDIQGYTMPFSALPCCAIPACRPHPQSKKRFASLVRRRSLVVAMGTGYAPPGPTHKAGDPGIGKDSGKVSGDFSCRTLF